MLRELRDVAQVPGEPHRRSFEDDGLDLVVWSSSEGRIVGIQLCYGKGTNRERALTWFKDRGFSHMRVDDGENQPGKYKMTPILVPDGIFDVDELLRIFEDAGRSLDQALSEAVADVIRGYPSPNEPLQPLRAAQPNSQREPSGSGPRG